jgi:hypothetical protein
MAETFQPGDRVKGMWDPGTVLAIEGEGREARVLIEWDPVDAVGTYLGPGRTVWRVAYSLSHLRTVPVGNYPTTQEMVEYARGPR